MNKEDVIELLKSNNADDNTLGIIIAIKSFSQEDLQKYFHYTLMGTIHPECIKYIYKRRHIVRDYSHLFIHIDENYSEWIYNKIINLDEE